MNYQVLARKWRPKSFTDVVGQQHVLKILANALSLGRVHHAYLFSGTRGVGKTSIARLLAKGLNCESGVTSTPCGVCGNCIDIEQGRFVDLLEIDAASRTKVEDTREILDNIQYLPTKGRFKVYLIDEVHMLSRSSFNALLKTLEEPPEHVKFLLATTDPQKLPITILSRCLHMHLSALDQVLIGQQLTKVLHVEHIPQEERAIKLLAKAANGSMRDALSLTDQAIALGNGSISAATVTEMLGTLDSTIPFSLVESLYQGNGSAVMEHIEQSAKQGVNWDNLLTDTINLLHQIACLQIVPTAIGDYSDHEERIRHLAQYVSPNDIQLFYQILLMGRKDLMYAPDKRVGVEMSFLRALAFVPKVFDDMDLLVTTASDTPTKPTMTTSRISTAVVTAQVETSSPNIPQATLKDLPQAKQSNEIHPIVTPAGSEQTKTIETKADPTLPVDSIDLNDVSNITKDILSARQQVIEQEKTIKKSVKADEVKPDNTKPLMTTSLVKSSSLNQGSITTKLDEQEDEEYDQTAETYQWQFSDDFAFDKDEILTAKTFKRVLEDEKTAELVKKLIDESVKIDPWSAEIEQMSMPPLIKQLLINAYPKEDGTEFELHLRSKFSHLAKNQTNIKKLTEILSQQRSQSLNVTVKIDDDSQISTPFELREKIYQDWLQNAKKAIFDDIKVSMLCEFFEAKIDDESIRPV